MIRKLLKGVAPEVEFLDLSNLEVGTASLLEMVEGALSQRKAGNQGPLVLFGFTPFERLKGPVTEVLKCQGLFYLHLPTSPEALGKFLDRVASERLSEDWCRPIIMDKITKFRHRWKNVWDSLESNANRALKALAKAPEVFPEPLNDLSRAAVEARLEEFRQIEDEFHHLGLKAPALVRGQIRAVIDDIGRIQEAGLKAREAVNLSITCAAKAATIYDLLKSTQGGELEA